MQITINLVTLLNIITLIIAFASTYFSIRTRAHTQKLIKLKDNRIAALTAQLEASNKSKKDFKPEIKDLAGILSKIAETKLPARKEDEWPDPDEEIKWEN